MLKTHEDTFCQLQEPHLRKEELKRLHEDQLLEQKIINDINGKLKDVKFVANLKNKG